MILAEAVNDGRREARRRDSLDICFDELAEHRTQFLGNHSQWEGLGGFKVEENGSENHGHQHPELLLGEDAPRIIFGL